MQPSDTGAGAGGVGRVALSLKEGKGRRVEQLAAAPPDPGAAAVALMHESEQREQTRPCAAPLVHRIGIMGLVVEQARIERADAIALIVKGARGGVLARGDEIAVLGVEQKDETQQDGEQAVVKMLLPARR